MSQTTYVEAYGTEAKDLPLSQMPIPRRALQAHDLNIEVQYCGICHSDLDQMTNKWGATPFPCVPGHEIVGRVTETGTAVSKFHIGDLVAVGGIVETCQQCDPCKKGLEQFCEKGPTIIFGSPDKYLGGHTFGGFSQHVVVDEHYVFHLPKQLDPAAAAPLLCAGITVYSPLKHWNIEPGKKVGIVGIGGLGHIAIKMAKAMGAYTVVFTTSQSKAEDARRLGADEVVNTKENNQATPSTKLDFILDTVSAPHSIETYLNLLAIDGTLVLVGLPNQPFQVQAFSVVVGRKSLAGSNLGGITEIQEMLDFCAEHQIEADIELVNIQQVNEAFERMQKGDVHYRFVVDMKSLSRELT